MGVSRPESANPRKSHSLPKKSTYRKCIFVLLATPDWEKSGTNRFSKLTIRPSTKRDGSTFDIKLHEKLGDL